MIHSTPAARRIMSAYDPSGPARNYAECLEHAEDDDQIAQACRQIDSCRLDRMIVGVFGSDRVALLLGANVALAQRLRSADPSLTREGALVCRGDLDLRGLGQCEVRCLEEVQGTLRAKWAQELRLPRLRRVGGSVVAQGSSHTHLPRLEEVGAHLWIMQSVRFHAPTLRRVHGDLSASGARAATLIALQEVGELNTEGASGLLLPARRAV